MLKVERTGQCGPIQPPEMAETGGTYRFVVIGAIPCCRTAEWPVGLPPPLGSEIIGTYSITERGVSELIPLLGSQPAGDASHKPGGRLPLLSARPAVTPATRKRAATSCAAW